MARPHFVVDGSNLATEGRTMPSFAQLREAVAALRAEQSDATITVVVDASFEHRIDKKEQPAFHAAEAAGELVSPPAGAIGRGDGFLLQIANRTGGTVVSNDSFQEFHGEYEWLFEPGRLIGGKPVPGVGWIFSLRSPVRGPKSHRAVRVAAREAKADKAVTAAIAAATADALAPPPSSARRRRRREGPPPGAVNDPHPFLMFVINHPLGGELEGSVEEFASHGAFVRADGVRAYVPLTAMGDPPPKRARDVLQRGSTRTFVVQAVDAPRRGIELALPGFARISGSASPETVDAEMQVEPGTRRNAAKRAPSKKATGKKATGPAKKAAPSARAQADTIEAAASPNAGTAKKATVKKVAKASTAKRTRRATKKVGAAKKAVTSANSATKRTPAKKAATATKPAAAKQGATKKKAAASRNPGATKKTAATKTRGTKADGG
jgi:hypothetical protein